MSKEQFEPCDICPHEKDNPDFCLTCNYDDIVKKWLNIKKETELLRELQLPSTIPSGSALLYQLFYAVGEELGCDYKALKKNVMVLDIGGENYSGWVLMSGLGLVKMGRISGKQIFASVTEAGYFLLQRTI